MCISVCACVCGCVHVHTHTRVPLQLLPNLVGVMAEALHPPLYYHMCNNINMAAVNESGPACIIHTVQKKKRGLDTAVWKLHPLQSGSSISQKTRELSPLPTSILSHRFPISVTNESLFRWEMRFSFPLFLSIHPSPLCNSLPASPCSASSPRGTIHPKTGISVVSHRMVQSTEQFRSFAEGKTTLTVCVTSSLLFTLT